jgi:hypothetical protein
MVQTDLTLRRLNPHGNPRPVSLAARKGFKRAFSEGKNFTGKFFLRAKIIFEHQILLTKTLISLSHFRFRVKETEIKNGAGDRIRTGEDPAITGFLS